MAQNTKETNGRSNPWFNYSHARSGVVMSFFCPHVHSICMRCINWPSIKWTSLHTSNYHMGWIFVQKCVPPCTRVCVRGNECVRAHLRFVHVLPVCVRENEYILLETAACHSDQSTQERRDNASTCATWLHELKKGETLLACHWSSNLRVLHILEVVVRYTCIARIRFGNQIMNKYHTIACKLWVNMHDLDVHLILIVRLIQNQLVFIKELWPLWFVGFTKCGNRKNMGL